mmetsp:Transcript_4591/g.7705  ORF Transcript_4591/g.7705 Transcript_4591/m.7705 type:complete len:92 (-) Transcript_4591:758-1033(-)
MARLLAVQMPTKFSACSLEAVVAVLAAAVLAEAMHTIHLVVVSLKEQRSDLGEGDIFWIIFSVYSENVCLYALKLFRSLNSHEQKSKIDQY